MFFEKKYPKQIFVYLLLENKKVVYVGQTTNGLNRIKQHFKNSEKKFDDYKIIKCSKKDLNEIENFYILKYKPKYNKKINSSNVKITYIIAKLKDVIGFNPYSIKGIEKIIEKSNFQTKYFNGSIVLTKKDAEIISNFLINKYYKFESEIEEYFERVE